MPTTSGSRRIRQRREAATDDAETITTAVGGRCFTASAAELRWVVRRLQTAGYRCDVDPQTPTPRHRRLASARSTVGPIERGSPSGDRQKTLELQVATNDQIQDKRAVPQDSFRKSTNELQDAVLERARKNSAEVRRRRRRQHLYAKRLHHISHILHYCSIAILGIFAFQVRTQLREQ